MSRISKGAAPVLALALFAGASSNGTAIATAGTQASEESEGGEGAEGDPYVIGYGVDVTGQYAEQGEGLRVGIESYVEALNAAGGIGGRELELVLLDDASAPDRAVANVTTMLDRGALGVGGFVLSNVCGAVAAELEGRDVPLVCNSAGDDLIVPAQPFIYTARALTPHQAEPAIEFASTLVDDGARIAFLNLGSAAIQGYVANAKELAEEKGWEIVAHEEAPVTSPDVTALVAKVVAAEPDVIIGGLPDAAAVATLRALAAQDASDIPLINYDGGASSSTLEAGNSENFYVLRNFSFPTEDAAAEHAGVQQFIDDVEAAGHDPAGVFVVNGYLQGMLWANALEGCADPCTSTALQESLDSLAVDTEGLTSGPMVYSPERHEAFEAYDVYHWDPDKGQPTRVAEGLAAGTS